MDHLLNNNRLAAVVAGGVFFMLAALLTQKVEDLDDPHLLRKSTTAHAGAARLSE
jgi:hypothetical protein